MDKLYGAHPWHWYISQGLPAVFGGLVPTVALGGYWAVKNRPKVARVFVSIMVFVTVALSMTAHKEFRFVLPLLPLACVLSGYALDVIETATGSVSAESNSARTANTLAHTWRRAFVAILICALALNAVVAGFVSLVHQRGAIDVVNFLASEAGANGTEGGAGRRLTGVHFLTPCHATPYHSMLHVMRTSKHKAPMTMRFLDCSPEIMVDDFCRGEPCSEEELDTLPRHAGETGLRDGEKRLTQSAAFELDPGKVIRQLYRQRPTTDVQSESAHAHPQRFSDGGRVVTEWYWGKRPASHVVIFTSEESQSVKEFLEEEKHCTRITDFFHEMVQGDIHATRMRGRIAVWYCPPA